MKLRPTPTGLARDLLASAFELALNVTRFFIRLKQEIRDATTKER